MATTWLAPLLAQVYREDFGRGFRGASSQRSWHDLIPYVAVFTVVCGGWAVYNYIKRRNDMTERCSDPHKLFRELSQVHELDRPSRRLLLSLSQALNFAQPAQVFLTPAAFDLNRLPVDLRGRAEELKQLRDRLFQASAAGGGRQTAARGDGGLKNGIA
jgi:hypothetical protein